ncbi:MAG TPA: hypothetical protein DCE56_13645 [Cyanobacteria bacterium UBA8553]|nr:hypothetical protein [Cyanobacteria bacterium UBA8553]HAJ61030.1 hypothetical protein [Cyanobacteria bacterium UBA8543]
MKRTFGVRSSTVFVQKRNSKDEQWNRPVQQTGNLKPKLRYWDKRGNPEASAIVEALTTEHLMTLLDDAFGIKRTASNKPPKPQPEQENSIQA